MLGKFLILGFLKLLLLARIVQKIGIVGHSIENLSGNCGTLREPHFHDFLFNEKQACYMKISLIEILC